MQMKYIISGTNRPGSRTLQVTRFVQQIYKSMGEQIELIDLSHVGLEELGASAMYGDSVPAKMKTEIQKINSSEGVVIVTPEYNGSIPGALKYFLDHWSYPDSYEFRAFALIGLGTRFGALRPVEHLQGILGFRNAFIYPERVFITNIHKALDASGQLTDAMIVDLIKAQAKGFSAFTRALVAAHLDANHHIASKLAQKNAAK